MQSHTNRWISQDTCCMAVSRSDYRILGVVIGPAKVFIEGLFTAMALEARRGVDVLEEHSHQWIGQEYKSIFAAKIAAIGYAIKWLDENSVSESCKCEEIKPSSIDDDW